MKFKKLAIASLVCVSALTLAACGSGNDDKKDSSSATSSSEVAKKESSSSKEETKEMKQVAGGELKDGSYKLEEKNYDKNGWKV